MATDILSIGQSALAAAQAGIATTGNNIANASTPGYSRQVVIQAAAPAQNFGFGYVGQGTVVSSVMGLETDETYGTLTYISKTKILRWCSGLNNYLPRVAWCRGVGNVVSSRSNAGLCCSQCALTYA